MTRRLEKGDVLYRVIDPDHRDQNKVLAAASEDPGKTYESLSLFVARNANPAEALAALAPFKRAKALCGTRKRPPTPREMYEHGYRVVSVPASLILDAIESTQRAPRPLSIQPESGNDFRNDGHLNLLNGRFYSFLLSKNSTLLSEAETFEPSALK